MRNSQAICYKLLIYLCFHVAIPANGSISLEANLTLSEQRSFRFENRTVKLPDGIKIFLNEDFQPQILGNKGAQGVVYLVCQKENPENEGKIWALKYFYSKKKKDMKALASLLFKREGLEEEIEQAKRWQEFQNPVEVERIPGRNDLLLKTYIPGETLKSWVESGRFFLEENFKVRQKLQHLLLISIPHSLQIVGDLNASNLIYHEERNRWIVVDSATVIAANDEQTARKETLKQFMKKNMYRKNIELNNIQDHLARGIGRGKNRICFRKRSLFEFRKFCDQLKSEAEALAIKTSWHHRIGATILEF